MESRIPLKARRDLARQEAVRLSADTQILRCQQADIHECSERLQGISNYLTSRDSNPSARQSNCTFRYSTISDFPMVAAEQEWCQVLAEEAHLTYDDLENYRDSLQHVKDHYAKQDDSLRSRVATNTLPWDLFPKLKDLRGNILTPPQETKTRAILYEAFRLWYESLTRQPMEWLLKDMVMNMGKICLILEFIGAPDLLDKFIDAGVTDSSLPCEDSVLEKIIPNDRLRVAFQVKQYYTTVRDLEAKGHSIMRKEEKLPLLVIRSLGSGGHGTVDEVENVFNGMRFARKTRLTGRPSRAAFEKERINLPRLSHAHIVKFVRSYQRGDEIGMLLQPVATCDLKVFLADHEYSLDRREVLCRAFGCLPTALAYMHDTCSLRHKDIKPRNILVDLANGGNVLFTDFGISWDFSDGLSSATSSTGPFTFKYAPPETANRQARGRKADVFSLGCVFLEMAAVLANNDLDKLETFFRGGGSNPSTGSERGDHERWGYHSSTQEVGEWIKEQQEQTNDPELKMMFGWCSGVLKYNPEDRPTIQALAADIIKESSEYGLRSNFICDSCADEVKNLETSPRQNLLGDALPKASRNLNAEGQADIKDFAEILHNQLNLTVQEGVPGSPAVVLSPPTGSVGRN